MRLFLTRQHNGLYMVTKYKPVFAKVDGRDFEDAYIVPGEPVGERNFCDLILKLINIEVPLKRGDTIEIELNGNVIGQ
jgi:hypothetical protein